MSEKQKESAAGHRGSTGGYFTMSKGEALLTFLLFAAIVFVWTYNPDSKAVQVYSESQYDGPYHVVKVVDGDTIKINIDGEDTTVRLIGIDTPESVHPTKEKNVPEGKIASDYTKSLLEDTDVYIEYGEEPNDRYGRVLAYVYIGDDDMINARLLSDGYAQVYTVKPNNKYEEYFIQLEQEAQSGGRGLWSTGVFDDE